MPLITQDRPVAPRKLNEQARRAARGFGHAPGFVHTVVTDFGDEDQFSRRSLIAECTDMGDLPTDIAPRMPEPEGWFVAVVGIGCIAAVVVCFVIAAHLLLF